MAFFWVQQWVALPVIVEDPMGDVPQDTGSGPPHHGSQEPVHDDSRFVGQKHSALPGPTPVTSRSSSAGAAFYSQYSTLPGQLQRFDSGPSHQPNNPYSNGVGPNQPAHGFNLSAMAGALPEYGLQAPNNPQNQNPQHSGQRMSGASTPAVVYQLQQNLQYPAQGSVHYMNPTPFGGYTPQYQGYHQPPSPQFPGYPQYGHGQQRPGLVPQQFTPYPQVAQQYYYSGPMGGPGQQLGGYPNQATAYQASYSLRPGSGGSHDLGPQGGSLSAGQSGMDEFQGMSFIPGTGNQ
jgi:hypothetical protein